MYKVSTFLSETDLGYAAVPLFGPADSVFEKTAAASLLPEVVRFIEGLRPRKDAQYVLVNALGAGEFFGSNINGDHFPEAALIHAPSGWTGTPLIDRIKAKDWPYGFPTFYGAHPYAHHKNKDPSRAYGEIELAVWNDKMKRVELVVRVDHDKCERFGGMGVWDKLVAGQFPDVSMGSKVPYDTCSITLDKKLYNEALHRFDPEKFKHPGLAILDFHKKLKAKNGVGIRGLSITRDDYSEYCRTKMNQILPDGRKVFVWNDYPRFFDISFVFIGADRTAKVMIFIKAAHAFEPSVVTAEKLGFIDFGTEKTASVDDTLEHAFKIAKDKKGELEKEVPPNLPPGKAVPAMTRCEPDLPKEMMDALCAVPLARALSTTAGLGMVLRPREFQRIILVGMGKGDLADDLEAKNEVFPASDDASNTPMSPADFMPALARILSPMMEHRSGLGPLVEKRLIIMIKSPTHESKRASSLSDDLLRKMGSAYNGYRRGVMELVAHSQDLISKTAGSDTELCKLSSVAVEEMFTPLSFHYLRSAFVDEMPPSAAKTAASASVQRGIPLKTTPN